MSLADIRKFTAQLAPRILIHGAEGVEDLRSTVGALASEQHHYQTVVIDSLDATEELIWHDACRSQGWSSIESQPEFSLIRKASLHRAAAPTPLDTASPLPAATQSAGATRRKHEERHMQDFDDDAIDGKTDTKADTDKTTATAMPAVTKADTPTVPLGHKLVDPFAHYATIEGAEAFFDGDYVRIDQERGWIRGQEKEPIGATESFVAKIHEARHGWIKFAKGDGEGVERHTMLIMECPELPPCPACDNILDDHDEKQCDWRPVVYLPLRSVTDPDDVVCFTGTGKGARRAVAQLCRVYARGGADRQGKSPAITLNTWSFENNSGGTTTWPVFKLNGWEFFAPGVPAPPVTLIAVPVVPPAPAAEAQPRQGDMDDEVPF